MLKNNMILKMLMLFIIICIPIALTSCKSDEEINSESPIISEAKQKYIYSITLKNYKKYLDIYVEYNELDNISTFYVRGALTYAYYDKVIMEVRDSNSDVVFALNAGGNGQLIVSGRVDTTSIVDIAGTITFWM